ncbi:hypothetical protein, partial [Shewanella algae]|uniref:hypothetical protein n=1 Tax=Shewanella algae TaxID=38313 RepID=UPI001AAD489E
MSANSSDISSYSILTECTDSRSKRPQGVDDNRVAEGECSPVASVLMSASQGRRAGLYPWIMEWTHPLLTGLAMGHDEVVESHLERGWVHYEDYNHRFGY